MSPLLFGALLSACRPPGEELDSDDWGVQEGAAAGGETGDLGGGSGGESGENDGDHDSSDSEFDGLTVGAGTTEIESSGSWTETDPLTAVDLGGGAIGADHHEVSGPCDAEWIVGAALSAQDAFRIEAVYDPGPGDTAAEPCLWHLTYDIQGLEPGDYVLAAQDDEARVTVAPEE